MARKVTFSLTPQEWRLLRLAVSSYIGAGVEPEHLGITHDEFDWLWRFCQSSSS